MHETRPQTAQYGSHRVNALRAVLKNLGPGRFIDLGAGHGKLSELAVDLNWDVTALDARTDRFPPALLPKVRYIHASVDSDAWNGRDYDLIGCLGLYYHLSFEMQDRFLGRCAGRPLFLETHVAADGFIGEWNNALGPWVENQGIRGREFPEPSSSDDDRKENHQRASYENPVSFWPTTAGLREHAARHGYDVVWEFAHEFSLAERSAFLLMPS